MNCDRHMGFRPGCFECANDRIETLEWLTDFGEVWTRSTVARAGFPSISAAERALYRADRNDLVTRLKEARGGVALGV